MSCPNFHKVNARNYYVVGDETTHYDVEREEEVSCLKDEFDYDIDIDCACERGKEKGFTPLDMRDRSYFVRSMDAQVMMEKDKYLFFGKKSGDMDFNNFNFCMEIFVHSGHYSGMNYDWDIFITDNYGNDYRLSEYDDVDYLIEDLADDWEDEAADEWNTGMAKIQRKNLKNWVKKMIDECSDEADDMCRGICEEVYVCGGMFSNGEAIYYKEDSLKGKLSDVEAA